MSQNMKAYLGAFLYALIVGFSFLFVKLALGVTDPLNLLAHRFSIAFIAFVLLMMLKLVEVKLSGVQILQLLPISLFFPVLFFAFQAFGLKYITSSEAGIIQAAMPIFTLVLASVILKEGTNWIQKLAMLCSVIGVLVVFIGNGISAHDNMMIGFVLVSVSVLALAFYNVLVRQKVREFTPLEISYVVLLVGAVVFNVASVFQMLMNGTISHYFNAFLDFNFVVAVLYLGILASTLTAFLSGYVLSKMDAFRVSVFTNLSILFAIFGGVVFLNENVYAHHILGGVLIILGILGSNIKFISK